jgi:RNA polymerase sigma factor (sigma-70 family)
MMEATCGGKVPTAAALRNGDSPVIAEQIWKDGSRLRAYQNGYALFEAENKSTVFRADYCGGYSYYSRTGEVPLTESYFAETDWWVRLLMEAEDRLTHNRNARIESYEVSYESSIEDVRSWMQSEDPILEDFVYQEQFQYAFEIMTERQREVVRKYYLEGYEQKEIAADYGISQQAVAVTLSDVRKKFKKNRYKFE